MAGIYIHIPFCRQACRYCDFHFGVSVWKKTELLPMLLKEISERKDYLEGENIQTIYFGGGTPSVLSSVEISLILNEIYKYHKVIPDPEISFEANPEDLKPGYLKELKYTGINRLSIGIQSFNDSDLELMHRIHNSQQSLNAIDESKLAGFDNISIDLIYGLPRQARNIWEENLQKTFNLGIQHFSAYHLTYETGTIFDHWRKKGRLNPIPEEESLLQFKLLIQKALDHGYEHYEISNFALPGYQSKHNKSYWQQKKYLGIGPSAHSYNHASRRWNVSSNNKYIEYLKEGKDYFETETLSSENIYNEYVMTLLRMREGVNTADLSEKFGKEKLKHFETALKQFVQSGHVKNENGNYSLAEDGIFIADRITAAVFI